VSDLANKIKEKTLKDKKIKKNAYASEYAVRGFPVQTLYFSYEHPLKLKVRVAWNAYITF
jgi:hypothetical protein